MTRPAVRLIRRNDTHRLIPSQYSEGGDSVLAQIADNITANLRGPLLMNPSSRLCKQMVLSEDYPTRYPIFSMPPVCQPVQAEAQSEAIPA